MAVSGAYLAASPLVVSGVVSRTSVMTAVIAVGFASHRHHPTPPPTPPFTSPHITNTHNNTHRHHQHQHQHQPQQPPQPPQPPQQQHNNKTTTTQQQPQQHNNHHQHQQPHSCLPTRILSFRVSCFWLFCWHCWVGGFPLWLPSSHFVLNCVAGLPAATDCFDGCGASLVDRSSRQNCGSKRFGCIYLWIFVGWLLWMRSTLVWKGLPSLLNNDTYFVFWPQRCTSGEWQAKEL